MKDKKKKSMDMKIYLFQLLIVALTWLVFAQRGRNRLITSSRVSSKVCFYSSYFSPICTSSYQNAHFHRLREVVITKELEFVMEPLYKRLGWIFFFN